MLQEMCVSHKQCPLMNELGQDNMSDSFTFVDPRSVHRTSISYYPMGYYLILLAGYMMYCSIVAAN